ncbi:MAG: arylsulfatase [Akkermansiaceae bacterium]
MKNRLLVSLVALSAMASSAVGAASRPNVIFIITDDLGYGDLSCYGQKNFKTPNLDQLAAEGIRFTSHYAGAPVCAPSRCTLMTGFHTGHASIRGNGAFALKADPEDLTIATLMKRAGYSTALIGKSCVTGNTQTPETLAEKGFEYFYGTTDHKDGHFRNPRFVYENTKRVELEGNTLFDGPHYDVDLYTGKALEFVERQSEKPFFLVLSYPVPHASLDVPEDSLAKVRPGIKNDIDAKMVKNPHYKPSKEIKATYAGMISRVDDAVGSLVAKLKAKGMDENTLVLFSSDNGSHAEGGYQFKMLQSNGVLRGGKRDLYEGGIRVPLIARWPAGVPAGRVTDHASAFWDFMPTACDLLGIEAPSGIDGISFAATLTGKGVQKAHSSLYWEFYEMNGRRALRKGDWKLVQYGLEPGNFGKCELYNLTDDLSEENDLAGKHPERVAGMLEEMNAARTRSQRFPHPGLDSLGK